MSGTREFGQSKEIEAKAVGGWLGNNSMNLLNLEKRRLKEGLIKEYKYLK